MDCHALGARNDALPPTSLREARLCVGVFAQSPTFDVDLSGSGAKSIFGLWFLVFGKRELFFVRQAGESEGV